jgi:serine/threonine-protein kinase RsbW
MRVERWPRRVSEKRGSSTRAALTCTPALWYAYISFFRCPRLRMAAKSQRIEVTLETLLESVDLAESISMRIAEAVGFGEEELHKIGMAVREGVINAYNYGNQQDRRKKILMTVELGPEKMTVYVLDQGKGFDMTNVPDPLAEENLLRTSGRGLFLMRAFMDQFEVRRGPGGGAELVMVKNLPASENGSKPDK